MSGHRTYAAPRIRLSLIDRLIEHDMHGAAAPDASVDAVVRRIRASVQRDLEALLNARRPWRSIAEDVGALRKSILNYGLPNFVSGALNEPQQRDLLRREIEGAIQRHEPRLHAVTVTLVDQPGGTQAVLRLRIVGELRLEATVEPIQFETVVDTTTNDLTLHDSDHV